MKGIDPKVGGSGAPTGKGILKPSAESKATSQFPVLKVDLRYRNTLPDVPFDPYFLEIPFPHDFLWGFRQSTLERNYKYRIHMNAPQLSDDVIDPLGAEEWAKAVLLDEQDKSLQRKDGETKVVAKRARSGRDAKTWMVKTVYTRENVHDRTTADMHDEDEVDEEDTSLEVPVEDQNSRIQHIKQQFELANSGILPKIPPGKQIRSIRPLLPSRKLREVDLHLIRFKMGERIMHDDDGTQDDLNVVTKGVLLRRLDNREEDGSKNAFTPLSLFLPRPVYKDISQGKSQNDEDELQEGSNKKVEEDEELFGDDEEDAHGANGNKANDEDDELFGDDEEPPVSSKKKKKQQPQSGNAPAGGELANPNVVDYIREYQVHVVDAKNKHDRLSLFFEADSVRYAELEPQSLRLFRVKQHGGADRRRAEKNITISRKVNPGDDDASNSEDDEAVVLSAEERRARVKRRRAIEGADLAL